MGSAGPRIAVVTGVGRSRGIGAAVCRALAADGMAVYATWHPDYDARMPWPWDPDEPERLLQELGDSGVAAAGMPLDLADPTAAHTLFEAANAELGPLDILINNAAHSERDGIEALTADRLDAAYAVNLRATALLCAEFVRRHDGRPHGRIVNLTSGQGIAAMPDELAYAATKGAVDAFTVSLAAGVAGRGITVNAVDPGPTDTGWMTDSLKAEIAAGSPRGRLGRPEDAARLVRFLASTDADWISGQILHSRG